VDRLSSSCYFRETKLQINRIHAGDGLLLSGGAEEGSGEMAVVGTVGASLITFSACFSKHATI